MKKSTIFYVLTASIGPMIIVALFPITMYLGYAFAVNPKDLYIAIVAYWGILQPLCALVASWIMALKITTDTKKFLWIVNAVYVPIATIVFAYLIGSVATGRVSIPFSCLDDYIVLLWLLLWSVVGTLLGYLKYKKTLKKGKNTPIMP